MSSSEYGEIKNEIISNFGTFSNETVVVSMVISKIASRKRSAQQTHISVELESVVYGPRNIENEIEEEFNSYIGNVTAELFQLISINQVEARDRQNKYRAARIETI